MTRSHVGKEIDNVDTTGNIILVTGATSGIGRALAVALHQAGNTVIVSGRRESLLQEIRETYPGMHAIQVDLADPQALHAFAKQVIRDFPELNVLINNAGIAKHEDYKADTVDTDTAVSTIQTNITSVVQLTAALLPSLRAQPKSTLMVTTSGLVFVPYPKGPVYGATKAFLHSWLDAIRFQLRGTSVEVLELAPPYVQTELGGPDQASDPRAMPLDQYIQEVMQILSENTFEKGEILVERVKPMRFAERNGQYDQMLEALGNM
ncbi:MAG: SDR family oxidoreductase [Janthinobacterium lividum]